MAKKFEHIISIFKYPIVNIDTPIIIPYETMDRLGYITNYCCYVITIGSLKFSFNDMLDFVSKEKNTDVSSISNALKNKTSNEIKKYLTTELKFKYGKISVNKISRLYETSSDSTNVCDFLRPNMLIGSMSKYTECYSNTDIFITWEYGKIFCKNKSGKRCENKVLEFDVYYTDKYYALSISKEIVESILGGSTIQEVKTTNFEKWLILSKTKTVGSITDRCNIDCTYFNKNNLNKILIKTKIDTGKPYIDITLKKENINFDEDDINSIQQTIDLMSESKKINFGSLLLSNGYYSLYCDNNKKIYLLKKDMLDIKYIKVTDSKYVCNIPCIMVIKIYADNLL